MQQLAAEFEVSARTVKRDLAAVAAGSLPVWGRPGPSGGYGLASAPSLPPVNVTVAQAVALSAAMAAAAQAPFADAARSATRKVLDVLDPAARRRATELAHRVWVDVEPMIFALNGGRWYLVAWCRWREDVRWFDLSRIARATATRHPCSGHDLDEIGTPPERARPAVL